MLKRAVSILLAMGSGVALLVPAAAAADESHAESGVGECGIRICVEAGVDGSAKQQKGASESNGAGGETSECMAPTGEPMPCSNPVFGTYFRGCYAEPAAKQPPKSDPIWQGHTEGAIYSVVCPYAQVGSTGGGWLWLPEPPGGPQIDPAQLAQRALDKMTLKGPNIRIRPKPSGTGVVGMPVWMWTQKSPTVYGPNSASASAGGITVTATAKVESITWDMGDGHSVVCHGAGTPYKPSYGKQKSPDCGHVYRTTSEGEPGGAFTVEATSTWDVDWSGGGESGELTTTRTSHVQVRVGEVQVLN